MEFSRPSKDFRPSPSESPTPRFDISKRDTRFHTGDVDNPTTWSGHGTVRNGRVLVAMSTDQSIPPIVVTEEDWRARFIWVCPHRLKGWACKTCLEAEVSQIE